jgi:hypothetical protein
MNPEADRKLFRIFPLRDFPFTPIFNSRKYFTVPPARSR